MRYRIAACICCSIFVIWTQLRVNEIGWPGIHWDSQYFSNAAISLAVENRWTGSSVAVSPAPDGSVERYSHGVVGPFLFGRLLNCRSGADLMHVFAWLNGITFSLWMCGLCLLSQKTDVWGVLKSIAIGLLMCHVAVQTQGRPEQLAPIIMLPGGVLWARGQRGAGMLTVLAISAGVLFVTSPMLGLIGGMMIIAAVGLRRRDSGGEIRQLATLACLGAISLFVAITILAVLSEDGPLRWFSDLRGRESDARDLTSLLYFWQAPLRASLFGNSVVFPLWNVIFFLCIGVCFVSLLRRSLPVSACLFLVLAVLCSRSVTDYGIVPMIAAVGNALYGQWKWPKKTQWISTAMASWIPLTGVVCMVITLHQAFLAHRGGLDLNNARQRLKAIITEGSVVAFHSGVRPNMWLPLEECGSGYACPLTTEQVADPTQTTERQAIERFYGRHISYAVLAQTRRGDPPRELWCKDIRMKLAFENWARNWYSFVGMSLPVRSPGVCFAVYRRVDNKREN